VNSAGKFNVPFGRYKNPSLYNLRNLLAASETLRGKIISLGDYRDICAYAVKDDFVYLDPPYQPLSATANFTSYTKDAFSASDQKELSGIFTALDARGAKVMMSNSATDTVFSLYQGYRIERLTAVRAINSNPSGRGAIEELLILNY
jgi:DNA adenine methylase